MANKSLYTLLVIAPIVMGCEALTEKLQQDTCLLADLENDPQNCGSCGNVCPATPNGVAYCAEGQCQLVCDEGYTKQSETCAQVVSGNNSPVDNKPVDNQPVDNKPVDNKPVDNKPVDNKPIDNKPIDDQPDDPVDDTPKPLQWWTINMNVSVMDAATYCSSKTIDGHTGWRLPTMRELMDLYDYSVPGKKATEVEFITTASYGFFAEETYTFTSGDSLLTARFTVRFHDGATGFLYSGQLPDKAYVACVYGDKPKEPVYNRYTMGATADPVVEDGLGLMWTGCPVGLSGSNCSTGKAQLATYDQAVTNCDQLTWAGKDDWRLPTPQEVLHIFSYTRTIGSMFAPGTVLPAQPSQDASWWLQGLAPLGWKVRLANTGGISTSSGSNSSQTICVRDNQ